MLADYTTLLQTNACGRTRTYEARAGHLIYRQARLPLRHACKKIFVVLKKQMKAERNRREDTLRAHFS